LASLEITLGAAPPPKRLTGTGAAAPAPPANDAITGSEAKEIRRAEPIV